MALRTDALNIFLNVKNILEKNTKLEQFKFQTRDLRERKGFFKIKSVQKNNISCKVVKIYKT